MTFEPTSYRERLTHVRWIGGPPDAGKTTTATLIADQFEATLYQSDHYEMRHLRAATLERQPRNAQMLRQLKSLGEAAFFEHGWLHRDPATMANDARANWAERMELICEDLVSMPTNQLIIAEGPGF